MLRRASTPLLLHLDSPPFLQSQLGNTRLNPEIAGVTAQPFVGLYDLLGTIPPKLGGKCACTVLFSVNASSERADKHMENDSIVWTNTPKRWKDRDVGTIVGVSSGRAVKLHSQTQGPTCRRQISIHRSSKSEVELIDRLRLYGCSDRLTGRFVRVWEKKKNFQGCITMTILWYCCSGGSISRSGCFIAKIACIRTCGNSR